MKLPQKILIIEKQTALERYTRRALNVDFLDYIEHGGGSLGDLKSAHDAHAACRAALLTFLKSSGVSYDIWNLDQLAERTIPFFHQEIAGSGIESESGLVVSLGGDGTLLHASHYLGNASRLLGLNSCPEHSVGALCGAMPLNFQSVLADIFSHKSKPLVVSRLDITLSEGPKPPLALNDILLCNQHPAATSRYELRVIHGPGKESIESQHSSGLWVSTAAGSSAAISGYGLAKLPLESKHSLVAVREPYQKSERYKLNGLQLALNETSLEVFCKMRAGLVCVDGPDHCALLGFGTTLRIESSPAASIQLYSKAH